MTKAQERRHQAILANLETTLVSHWRCISGSSTLESRLMHLRNARLTIGGMLNGILAVSIKDYGLVHEDLMLLWNMTLVYSWE